jgi:hypothetical protein
MNDVIRAVVSQDFLKPPGIPPWPGGIRAVNKAAAQSLRLSIIGSRGRVMDQEVLPEALPVYMPQDMHEPGFRPTPIHLV